MSVNNLNQGKFPEGAESSSHLLFLEILPTDLQFEHSCVLFCGMFQLHTVGKQNRILL